MSLFCPLSWLRYNIQAFVENQCICSYSDMDPTGDRSRYRDDGISNAGRLLDSVSVEPAQVPHDPNQISSVVAGRSDSVATMGKDGAKGRPGTVCHLVSKKSIKIILIIIIIITTVLIQTDFLCHSL